ncbi:Uncharacterised protein [Clostridioides difficile]|uniref:Uncharacterized protein n=1 Tax=Clostridioides difficile TaxID=1496 RepID=A0AB74R3N9_CLODI|nr:hypothetical protein CDIF27638_03228 [Clostridioides difficile]EQH96553.1 hypothetical protein QO5_3276 [Clostridioides difficile F253]EQJ38336.1 hypothetical protein QSC_3139 [Clostridioides difficile P23]EQJ77201.1 hypothetical protein QU5_3152 [Clostridioides difficile P45]EQK85620.1 hypothetical protein QSO_3153 [Clostridioides difficile P31]
MARFITEFLFLAKNTTGASLQINYFNNPTSVVITIVLFGV